jgi:acetylornithine deacetylase
MTAAALLDSPDVAERAAAELTALIAVPSVTGSAGEARIQHELADRLAGDGYTVDHWRIDLAAVTADPAFPGMEAPRDEAWGVVAEYAPGPSGASAGARQTLILNAHVDVVPPGDVGAWSGDPFRPWRAAGRDGRDSIYGRGASDMKGGLAAALLALDAVRTCGTPLRGRVLLHCVGGEEDGGLGTFATLRRGHVGDLAVCPEPTGADIICATAGALTFRLTVPGVATHGATRTAGVSAVEKFWPIWQGLQALEAERNAAPDAPVAHLSVAYPLSIGTVRAGDWASSVPDRLVAEGRYGVRIGEEAGAARQALRDRVAAVCAADPWLADHPAVVEFTGGQFEPGYTPPDHPLVGAVRAIHTALTDAEPAVLGAPYGSDLRLLSAAGIPTVHYGPGDVRLAHGPDEHVALADVVRVARALAALIVRVCG